MENYFDHIYQKFMYRIENSSSSNDKLLEFIISEAETDGVTKIEKKITSKNMKNVNERTSICTLVLASNVFPL